MRGKKFIPPEEGTLLNNIQYVSEAGRGYQYKILGNFICHCGNEFISQLYRISKGLTKSCGCMIGKSQKKLTQKQADIIRELIWKEARPLQEIADKFNVSIGTIFNIKMDRTHNDVA